MVSWQRSLSRRYEMEAEYGGGTGYELAVQSLTKLRRALQRASYDTSTGEALHTVEGQLTQHGGHRAGFAPG